MTSNTVDIDVDEEDHHTLLVNHKAQHSLWPANLPPPPGWNGVGVTGTRVECSAYVDAFGRVDPIHSTATRWRRCRPTVHGRFSQRAHASPDAIAVSMDGEEVTYGQVEAVSNQIAHALRRRGVKTGSLVGVCVQHGCELPSVLLGVLKAGAAYVPLDTSYPPSRLELMLDDTVPHLVIGSSASLAALPTGDIPTLRVDDPGWHRGEPTSDPGVPVIASDLAYVMYTSGSTGRPKGVAIEHEGIVSLVSDQRYASFGAHQVVLMMAPLSFDASTFEIWGALLHGARCAVFPPGAPRVTDLRSFLAGEAVTQAWLTSSLFNVIVDNDPEALSGLSELLIGGEAVSVTHVRRAQTALAGTRIINGYGPTENTTFTCCHPIPPVRADETSVPIGTPIVGAKALILDADLRPTADGESGELYVGGRGLARGYFHRPGMTADRFMAHPCPSKPGERLYRTGDRARRLPDGIVDFLGRVDDQVKVRGFRIEPGEIERVLHEQPFIRAGAVVAQGIGVRRRLVAYVVLHEDGTDPPNDQANQEVGLSPTSRDVRLAIRSALAARLPGYMLPANVVPIRSLPLTPNGKVDRRALSDWDPSGR